MIVGSGAFTYRVVEGWPRWPADLDAGVVSSVATDSADRVYLLVREPRPVVHVFTAGGDFVRSWGRDELAKPHSIWIGPDDEVLIADIIHHQVFRFTIAGELVEAITAGPSGPFCKPTWAVRGPSGDLFVAGGYGQDCVHRLDSPGRPGVTWGRTGTAPGEFRTPHGIRVDSLGRVVVVDRGNARIQRFDRDGRFLDQWQGFLPANDVFIGAADVLFVAECDRRISVVDPDGGVLARLTGEGRFEDYFHGVWVDTVGAMYACEVKTRLNRVHKLVPA